MAIPIQLSVLLNHLILLVATVRCRRVKKLDPKGEMVVSLFTQLNLLPKSNS
jgi:hypothetical protein